MALSYEEAVALLYRAPLEKFVEERKGLALRLKGEGDKAGAARLLARARPPVSAWVVNQLWWQAGEELQGLFAAAARQRAGERAAAAEHRERLAQLRAHAAELLRNAGHGASEATLRRVTTTLSALAVAGSFEPDEPGTLSADRDPPGFDALAMGDWAAPAVTERKSAEPGKRPKRAPARDAADASLNDATREEGKARRDAEERAARAEAERQEAERRRKEAERVRIEAERARLTSEFERAQGEFDARERAAAERRQQLRAAEAAAEQARLELNEARARLKEFEREHR